MTKTKVIPVAFWNLLELLLHILAQLEVKRGERLIEQQHLGAADEGARDGDALLLAAGKARDAAVLKALERDEGEHLPTFSSISSRSTFFSRSGEGNVLKNVQVREQGVALEDGVDIALIGGTSLMFSPMKIMSPLSGVSKPPMRRSVVVLPHPEGPKSVRNSLS